ncbi:RAF protein, partial [Aphelenchoides avenae]
IACEVSSEPSCANVTMRGKLVRHSPMTLVYSLEEKREHANMHISYATAAGLLVITVAMIVFLIYGRFRQVRARQEWEIPYKQLHIEEKIGQGMYGVVYRAYRYGPVAVKQLYMAHPSPSVRRSLENEIQLLKSLRHSNVLNLLGVVTRPQLAIVTDWCYCSLYHKLHVAETKYDEQAQLRVCSQIAEGMNYLHSKAILH